MPSTMTRKSRRSLYQPTYVCLHSVVCFARCLFPPPPHFVNKQVNDMYVLSQSTLMKITNKVDATVDHGYKINQE
jgi:hypothetical protein